MLLNAKGPPAISKIDVLKSFVLKWLGFDDWNPHWAITITEGSEAYLVKLHNPEKHEILVWFGTDVHCDIVVRNVIFFRTCNGRVKLIKNL